MLPLSLSFHARLNTAQAEINKRKDLAGTVDQRILTKMVMEDAKSNLQSVKEKVRKAVDMITELGEPMPGSSVDANDHDKLKGIEEAVAEARVALKVIARFMETHSRPQSIARDQVSELQPLVRHAQ